VLKENKNLSTGIEIFDEKLKEGVSFNDFVKMVNGEFTPNPVYNKLEKLLRSSKGKTQIVMTPLSHTSQMQQSLNMIDKDKITGYKPSWIIVDDIEKLKDIDLTKEFKEQYMLEPTLSYDDVITAKDKVEKSDSREDALNKLINEMQRNKIKHCDCIFMKQEHLNKIEGMMTLYSNNSNDMCHSSLFGVPVEIYLTQVDILRWVANFKSDKAKELGFKEWETFDPKINDKLEPKIIVLE
jgi:hypothetical protein